MNEDDNGAVLNFDCPPETDFLDALKNDRLTWKDALAELIDNSFDAAATRVVIAFSNKRVVVSDDGSGVEDIQKLITIGKHTHYATTRSGRYGIGFKSAACWLWGPVVVRSVHKAMEWSSAIDWDKVRTSGKWQFSQRAPRHSSVNSGLSLEFQKITRSAPKSFDALIADIAFIFTPGLKHLGKQILFEYQKTRTPCAPYDLPPLDMPIEDRFEINGKTVFLKAGVVKEGEPNGKPGFIYYHGHRVIEHGSLGAKGYSVKRIAATVQLGKGWALAKNKNEISDDDRAVLDDEIYQRCLPILRSGQDQASSIQLQSLTSHVEANFARLFSGPPNKEKRDRPDPPVHPGTTVVPIHGPKRRRKASKTQRDDEGKIKDAMGSGLKIFWMDMPGFDGTGRAEILPTLSKVTFNTLHPYMLKIQRQENTDAIAQQAIFLLAEEVVRHKEGPQRRLPFPMPSAEGLGLTDLYARILSEYAAQEECIPSGKEVAL